MTSEKKKWTLEEIRQIELKEGMSRAVFRKNKEPVVIEFRKDSSDGRGDYLVRLFKRVDDHFDEIDVKKATEKMARFLAKNVTAEKLIREVLIEESGASFSDLVERIEKEPRVTVSTRRGSCVYLHIRGKQGRPAILQLTE